MSHFPVGQVQSDTPGWPATRITQALAETTQRITLATYRATVNLAVAGGTQYTLFTTDANKGRFFPLWLTCFCTAGQGPGSISGVLSVGWDPGGSQPYIDFLNQVTIPKITTNAHGNGNYVLNSPSEFDFNIGQYSFSAPPSTDIVLKLGQATNSTTDVRTFVIVGFYTSG